MLLGKSNKTTHTLFERRLRLKPVHASVCICSVFCAVSCVFSALNCTKRPSDQFLHAENERRSKVPDEHESDRNNHGQATYSAQHVPPPQPQNPVTPLSAASTQSTPEIEPAPTTLESKGPKSFLTKDDFLQRYAIALAVTLALCYTPFYHFRLVCGVDNFWFQSQLQAKIEPLIPYIASFCYLMVNLNPVANPIIFLWLKLQSKKAVSTH